MVWKPFQTGLKRKKKENLNFYKPCIACSVFRWTFTRIVRESYNLRKLIKDNIFSMWICMCKCFAIDFLKKSFFKRTFKIRLFYEKLTWKIGNTEIKIKTLEYRRRYTLCTYSSFCRCSKKKKRTKTNRKFNFQWHS